MVQNKPILLPTKKTKTNQSNRQMIQASLTLAQQETDAD